MLARNKAAVTLILPSDREILLTRVFNAPRRRVFEAWTNPEHVKQWYGCSMKMSICEIDLRIGGKYRYVMRDLDGVHHTVEGVYREITPPKRLVYTERYVTEDFASNEALVTVIFAEHDGMTTLTVTILHESKEYRDRQLSSGMEHGAAEIYDKLEAYVATIV